MPSFTPKKIVSVSELVEAKNSADQLIYSVDKTIKDLGDKVDAGEIEKANAAKEKLKAALDERQYRRNQSSNGRVDRNCSTAVR